MIKYNVFHKIYSMIPWHPADSNAWTQEVMYQMFLVAQIISVSTHHDEVSGYQAWNKHVLQDPVDIIHIITIFMITRALFMSQRKNTAVC